MFYVISFSVSEENIQKNISTMGKSIKQLEMDLKNHKAQSEEDRFAEVMTISFSYKPWVQHDFKFTCRDLDRTRPACIFENLHFEQAKISIKNFLF